MAEIVVDPIATAVAKPVVETEAKAGAEEFHVAVFVRSCVLPSLKLPVAVICWVAPTGIEAFEGVIVMDTNVGCVTVNNVEPLTDPDVAAMVDDPTAAPLARPEPEIVAAVMFVDDHATVVVRFFVLPSLYVPVAVNCCVAPKVMEGFMGVTAIETKLGATTVNVAEPVIELDVAEMFVVPAETLLAIPLLPIPATLGDEELHVEVVVRSLVLPSVYVPVAVNCWFAPCVMEAVGGVTAIETNAGGVTVNRVLPVSDPEDAPIVTLPIATVLTWPPADTPAVARDDELHCALPVRFWDEPSLKVPVAVSCSFVPSAID